MILSIPLFVMTGEPDCQNTWFPFPVTVILLQEPSKVTVFACPRISAALPLQVKVKVWSLPVTTIGSVLTGGGCTMGGIAVGGATVGNGSVGMGVAISAGGSVFVGAGVGVSARVAVSVDVGTAVSGGSPVETEVAVAIGDRVVSSVGVNVMPGTSPRGVCVGCLASTGGS